MVKKSVNTLINKCILNESIIFVSEDENGNPVAVQENSPIPSTVLQEIHDLHTEGLSFEDAIVNIRGALVPTGYTPYPFRKDTPESFLDMLRSVVATYMYRDIIHKLQMEGRDFVHHLYVPGRDPITGKEHHERGDHNHILKRIAGATRECRYPLLDPEAFDKAMQDPDTGLSHAALTGQRPQSVEDAERLLSYHVASSMQKNGFDQEAEYILTVASWHEASDGRGLSQLDRCKSNHQMLNYLLDEFLPWHRENYDFTTLDINRFVHL